MEKMLKYITIITIIISICAVVLIYNYKNDEVDMMRIQLEMYRIESSNLKQRVNEEREMNNEFGLMVNAYRDTMGYYKTQRSKQDSIIAQLNREKNEIGKIDYSMHSDSDLSRMLSGLFSEQDSLHR